MKKNIVSLLALRSLKICISVFTLALSAKYFGIEFDRDVWLLSFSFITVLDSALWGPINETFRAKFVFLKEEEGAAHAIRKTRALLLFTLIVCISIVFLIYVFSYEIVGLLAPKYSISQLEKLSKMLMLLAPCFLFTQFSQILISILNANGVFFIPEVAGFLTSGINIILIVILAPIIGIYSLLIANYIGIGVLLALICYNIRRVSPQVISFSDLPQIKLAVPFVIFALPFFLPYFFSQGNIVVEKSLAATIGTGYVSIIDYSRKFIDILFPVFSSVLQAILVPALALSFRKKDESKFVTDYLQIYRLLLLALTLVVSVFTVCSSSIVNILYDRGNISDSTLIEISSLSRYYMWSFVSSFFFIFIGLGLLSTDRGKKYAIVGCFVQMIQLIINLTLVNVIGIKILPFSLLICQGLGGVILLYYFPYKRVALIRSTLKYVSLLVAISLLLWVTKGFFGVPANDLLYIVEITVLAVSVTLLAIFVFKLEERYWLRNIVYRLCGK